MIYAKENKKGQINISNRITKKEPLGTIITPK